MKRSRFTEEQVTYALRQHEAGTPVADICRQLGVSEATFYVWKKKYAHMGVAELRELRQLREENARLKRVVADLTLDKQILSDVVKKKGLEARHASRAGGPEPGAVPRVGAAGLRLGRVFPVGLVPHPHQVGSGTIAGTDSRDCSRAATFRVPAHPRAAAP